MLVLAGTVFDGGDIALFIAIVAGSCSWFSGSSSCSVGSAYVR